MFSPLLCALVVLLGSGAKEPGATEPATLVRDGDLVFQRSRSSQSEAVALATGSAYTHVGVVVFEGKAPFVFEAVQLVQRTPLARWIARGEGGHVVIKRLKDADAVLTPEALAKMRAQGRAWLGRPYDKLFQWGDGRLYCSELVYKLYERGAGVRIGALQKVKDMDLGSAAVQKQLRERFDGRMRFDREETVITPRAMFEEPRLVTVYGRPAG